MKLLDRYKGSLVGVHVGDSLGAPYEKMFSAKQIARDIEKRRGLRMFDYRNPWPKDDNGDFLPAGRPTDDSDQTADLAYSLVTCNGLDTEHLRGALRESVMFGKSRLWGGQATGAGRTTKKALSDDPKVVQGELANTIGTNGSLMRCAPMALYTGPTLDITNPNMGFGNPEQEDVQKMSSVTHAHPHSIEACVIYTSVLCALLYGEEKDFVVNFFGGGSVAGRTESRLDDDYDFPYDPGDWPMRGTAEFSLYVALYALLKTTTFEEGIELAVRVGGDTDTYAAIAGGLLGAHYGYDAIPEDWRNTILGHDVMVGYAEKLYDMRLHN